MHAYLKMKPLSLAEETKLISKEEKRWLRKAAEARRREKDSSKFEEVYTGLNVHKRRELRRESRSAHIAYSFLKGRDYSEIEQKSRTEPDWTRIKRIASKYKDSGISDTELDNWLANAKAEFRESQIAA